MSTSKTLLKILPLLLAFFISFLCTAQQTLSAISPEIPRVKPHTLVFKLKQESEAARKADQARQLGELIAGLQPRSFRQKFPHARSRANLQPGEIDLTGIYELEYPEALPFAQVKQRLLASGLMDYVEPLYIPAPMAQPNDPYADSSLTDLSRANQYYLKKIRALKAWDLVPGDTSIVIGILDTGVRFTHEDLRNSIKYNYADPIDGRDNDQDGYIDNFRGWDLADNDNNPTADGNSHGVLMSGIPAATSGNGKGLAGVGGKTKFMPLKIYPSTMTGGFAGYEAIVYAADHGCQVISLSWGNPGFRSAYEQDIINYAAINKNVVIVAAAGNTAGNLDFFPASYDHVLSVAATDDRDLFPSFFTNSYFIDLLAPGVRVWTTGNGANNDYTFGTGTSFAAPVVAGAAALVRQRYPRYSALQVAEQLRMTADDVFQSPNNAAFPERLGRGRLNVYRAVTETNVKSVRNTANQVGTGAPVYPGDTLKITGSFTNLLAPVSNLAVSLTCTSPYVTIIKGQHTAGPLASLAAYTHAGQPFIVHLHPDIPINEVLTFRYGFTDGSYRDYQYFKVMANPDFVTLDVNDLAVTVTSQSNIGYNGFNYGQGQGVVYQQGPPLLSEGGLMIGASSSLVSDNIRNEISVPDQDFLAGTPARLERNPVRADQTAAGMMQDLFPKARTVGLKVSYRAYAWKQAPDRKYVILEYKVTNTNSAPLTNLYAGLFSDWDIGPANRNAAGWDSVNALGYVYNVDQRDRYAGVRLLTPGVPTHYAIDNAFGPPAHISLANGFSTAEKYQALANPHQKNLSAGLNGQGNDVSDVVGGKLPDLPAGGSALIAFAILAGDNLGDLQASAGAALNRYRQLKSGPAPAAASDTICPQGAFTLRPAGGSHFRFYADATGERLLAAGATFTTPALAATTTYYVSNADSLFESARVPFEVVVQRPAAAFAFSPDPVTAQAAGLVSFTAQTPRGSGWQWDFGDGGSGSGPNHTHRYAQAGTYPVRLVVTDSRGCVDTLTRTVEIKAVRFNRHWQPDTFILYPNPTPESQVSLLVPDEVDAAGGLALEVLNVIGEVMQRHQVSHTGRVVLGLSGLPNGMYLLRIQGKDGQVTKRFQVMRH
jgi:serine protease